jgi:hypothetical protein
VEKNANTSTAMRLVTEEGFSLRAAARQLGIDVTTGLPPVQ